MASANVTIMFTGPATLDAVPGTSPLLPSRVAQVHRALSGRPLEPLHVPRLGQRQPPGGRRPPQGGHSAAAAHGRGGLRQGRAVRPGHPGAQLADQIRPRHGCQMALARF